MDAVVAATKKGATTIIGMNSRLLLLLVFDVGLCIIIIITGI